MLKNSGHANCRCNLEDYIGPMILVFTDVWMCDLKVERKDSWRCDGMTV